tara:strand:- start:9648 stop:10199 length:552 start_codon:yes stop_codon:yes gene_type:complete
MIRQNPLIYLDPRKLTKSQIVWSVFIALFTLMCFFIAFGSQMCNTDIKIKDAKAYFPSETTGVAYFRVESEVADVMTGMRTEIADRAQLHTWTKQGDQNVMVPLEKMQLDPGDWLELEPGGLHVMLMGVKEIPEPGKTFTLVLEWERSGDKKVKVTVMSAAEIHAHDEHADHEHEHAHDHEAK